MHTPIRIAVSRRRAIGAALALVLPLSILLVPRPAVAHTGEQVAKLKGKWIVGAKGKGSGKAEIRSASEITAVCYDIRFKGIGNVTSASIREGDKGENGDVVVELFDGNKRRESPVKGCNMDVPAGTIEAIQSHPSSYYVELVNPDFPDGAMRGQMRNLEGSYSPPATCPKVHPVVPDSPSAAAQDAPDARFIRLSDARTERHPKTVEPPVGEALWAGDTPIVESTTFYTLGVDTNNVTAGLFAELEWDAPSASDVELYLYDAYTGELVAEATAADAAPDALTTRAVSGFAAPRCSGYVLEVRPVRSAGEDVRLSLWLGEEAG